MKQFNDLEICPRSLTVASPESCRVAMYVKFSEDSELMKRKSPFSTTPLSFDAPSPAGANISEKRSGTDDGGTEGPERGVEARSAEGVESGEGRRSPSPV